MMSARVVFPELTAAQAEVQRRKLEKARWMQAQADSGRSRHEIGQMLEPQITRQAVQQWIDWLRKVEGRV